MHKKIYSLFHRHYHSRYHGIYQHAKQLFVFDLFLLGLALVMMGSALFFFFWKPDISDLVELSISLGDARVKSGQEVRVTVDYTNKSKFALEHPVLAVRLPLGFVINRSSTPESVFSKNGTIALPTLAPGAHGQAEVVGWLWTKPKEEERIVATLSYGRKEKAAQEQSVASFLAKLPGSILDEELSLATSTFPGQTIPYSYTVTNLSQLKINDVVIENNHSFAHPLVVNFEPGEKKVFTGNLIIPENANDYLFTIQSSIKANNHRIVQTHSNVPITLISPNVTTRLRLLEGKKFVEPGQAVPLEITWKNESSFNLASTRLRLTFTTGTVDLKSTAKENHFTTDGSSIIVDKSGRTELASGLPGSNGTFPIKIVLLPHWKINEPEIANWEVKTTVEAEIAMVPGQLFKKIGEGLRLPMATEIEARAEARYYTDDGDQLGRGPLPPMVGKATKYWIFAQVNNSVNTVRNPSLAIQLAPGVQFTGNQSVTIGPPLSHSSGSSVISWKHTEIPANSQAGFYFEVAINPTPEQVNKVITLVNNISFSATDDVINKPLSSSVSSVSNQLLPNDKGAKMGNLVKGL